MKVTDWIMVLAMPGIFALTASSVGLFGLSMFTGLSKFLALLFIGFSLQLFVVYPIFTHVFAKINAFSIYRAAAEAMMVAFGTASSSATLPVTIACCERRVGISNKICSFVLPLGATMNMDATAMFQVLCVMFLTQAYGIVLDPFTIVFVCLFAMLASSTCAGIPGAGLITIALILKILGLTPDQLVIGFAFLFTVDRIADMFRTLINVTSDAVVATVIAANENELDYEVLENQDVWKEVV
jgi:Na+/H+-dicarboxylate symporter